MKHIPYNKPTGWKGNSLQGIQTGATKVTFKDGKNPYKLGQVVMVVFKQKKVSALVEGINDQSLTVSMKGVDRKKVIRYTNVVSVIAD